MSPKDALHFITVLLMLSAAAGCLAEPEGSEATVSTNAGGWPLTEYVVYCGTLGPGTRPDSHNVAYGIASGGWTRYIDDQVQPLLDGPNPPARLVVHCVGPGWPKVRDGETRLDARGGIQRWFEYDWPLTVTEGREREDGRGRWSGIPAYLDDFAAVWRSVATGERSGGFPIETYAYSGMIQTPWLEALRESDPSAYCERLRQVAEFFRNAKFAGIYVDAASARRLPSDHLGLRTLKEINEWPDFFVGVEAYPPAKHDSTTGALPFFLSHNLIKSQHPGFPDGPRHSWQSRLRRRGLVVWHNAWGGGEYRLTPETAQQTVAAGADIGVSWVRWKQLAPELPPQQLAFD